jgi:Neprosin
MKVWGRAFMLGVVGVLGTVGVSTAAAAETSESLYDCRPRNPKAAQPPPQPVLPPEVAATLQQAKASEDFERVCPQGEVPHPRGLTGTMKSAPFRSRAKSSRPAQRRERKRAGARASRAQLSPPYWYSHAGGRQYFGTGNGVNGLWVNQTNEMPYVSEVSGDKGHSLAQLWAVDSASTSCFSTTETGWRASPMSYGDPYPHLFMYAFDCGQGMGYAGSGLSWVQSSGVVFPNAVLSHNDTFHVYGTRLTGNNWWFYYDGHWVGYIPNAAWKWFFPARITRADAGGEVATLAYYTCTDMGYAGLPGYHPWAAMFADVWYEYNYNTQASSSYMTAFASDPYNWVTGNWSAGHPGSEFRYGGAGTC